MGGWPGRVVMLGMGQLDGAQAGSRERLHQRGAGLVGSVGVFGVGFALAGVAVTEGRYKGPF